VTAILISVVVSLFTGAVVNEFSDVSEWLAYKIIRRSARTWAMGDLGMAEVYEEEWAALISDCPGKLLKLFVALRFAFGAIGRVEYHRARRIVSRLAKGNATTFARDVIIALGGFAAVVATTWQAMGSGGLSLWVFVAFAVPFFTLGSYIAYTIGARMRRRGTKARRNRVVGWRWPWRRR
jgi:hypothetical protein